MVELMLMLFVIVIVLIVLAVSLSKGRARAARIRCVDNLKQLGLAARIFAASHTNAYPGELFPVVQAKVTADVSLFFAVLHSELSNPKVLVCPSDKSGAEAAAMNLLGPRNISYFANLSAREAAPAGLLFGDSNLQIGTNRVPGGLFTISSNTPLSFTAERHWNQGNVALADGSVQQFSANSLQRHLLQSGISSNVLFLP